MIKLQFSALIDGVVAKKDKTLTIKLGTQELTSDDTSYLFDLMGKQIWVGVAETAIEALDVPDELPEMHGEKTSSQRLRGIIYKVWELKTDKKIPFPTYYESAMFKLCEFYKNKLD